ncbi:MAG TPA: ATP-binding protein [Oculatellaceae cyanobacterium]
MTTIDTKPSGFRLRLSYQGLLLVGALLIMEFVFLGSFWTLLEATERAAQKEEHSKEVLARMQKMFRLVYDGGLAFELYLRNENVMYKTRLLGDISQILELVSWLRKECDTDEHQKQLLARVEVEMKQTSEIAKHVVHVVDTESEEVAESEIEKARQQLHDIQMSLVSEVSEALKTETQAALQSPIAQRNARHKLKTLLTAAIPLNVVLGVLLALFFTRSITSRLNVLVDNTERLREKRALNERMEGRDEISLLDTTFHEMAAALTKEEALLKASEERIRKIINSMPIGLIVLNKIGKVQFANPQIESMFKYSHDDLIGLPLQQLFGKTNISHAGEVLSLLVDRSEGADAVAELEARRKNGASFPVEVSLTEFLDAEGERRLLTVVDVTARHEVRRLRQAFVAMVSHELRAPLTSIRGFFSLLDMGAYGELSKDALEGAQRAESNTVRLISLINDLLDLEKMESGSFAISPKVTDVRSVVDDALGSVSTSAEQKNINIDTDVQELEVELDSGRIVQVLVNLLSNAIKFSAENSRVKVRVFENGAFAEFSVADEGRGIPAHLTSSIFEKFQQVEEADATVRGGSGLGLPISKAIIERHHGRIWVESSAGKGSTFYFQIPFKSDHERL